MRTTDVDSSQRVLLALKEARLRLEANERIATEPIAVVGIGCRFPGGAYGPDAYWERLLAGFDAVGPIPRDRYDADACYDPVPATPGAIYTREGAFVDGIDRFDAAFFSISPREAVSLDPQQRLLLEVAWEALEHAGQAPNRLRGSRTGVFVGIGRNDYALRLLRGETTSLTAWQATGNGLCYGPGRLAHVLDLKGPNMAIDTSCSSSLTAVHLACQSLRLRECDLALAGGCHVHLSPEVTVMLSMSRALAPDGRCKAFDAAADGFGQGEGCGIVVLRRLSDALGREDPIIALIRGSAVNHDGHSSGLTVPNQAAQEQVIRDALANARVQASDIGYVEAHGTGTPLGDPIEVDALAAVLCRERSRDNPLQIGSVKTNIGHLEAAAGIAGLIKVALALHHGAIPPHLHLKQPTPRIDWNALPIRIPTRSTPWRRGAVARFAGVSSFGMSGTNAHVVLQEAPPARQQAAGVERPLHLVTLSAHSANALRALAGRFGAHLAAHPDLAPADIAYTANTGRSHWPVRVGLVADSSAGLVRELSALASGQTEAAVAPDDETAQPGVVFLFSGQGSQYRRMGCQLYETQPVFRRVLNRCDEILEPQLKASLCGLLFSDDDTDRRLDQTRYTQPALFAIEYALAQLWRSWGVVPRAVLGHSVGEYVAACVAGVVGLDDGLRLIAERARLMQELPSGGMAAVFASERRVRQVIAECGADVALAAVNGASSVVLAGPSRALHAVLAELAADGIDARALSVSHAFHSAMMEPMLAPFAEAARRLDYAAPRIELVSNVTGALHVEAPGADYWAAHVRAPVRFADGLDTLDRCGYRVYVEIGPGGALLGMAGRHWNDKSSSPVLLPSLLPGRDDWQPLLRALARLYELGAPIDWDGFDQEYARRRVTLPTYPFERQRFWTDGATVPARPPVAAYRLRWREHGGLVAGPAEPRRKPRQWLIFTDQDGLGQRVGRLLERRGERCIHVAAGRSLGRSAAAHWTLDPCDAAGLARLLAELLGPSQDTGILWLWDGGDAPPATRGVDTLLSAQLRVCGALLHLVQALAAHPAPGARLWIVTRDAVAVDPESPLQPEPPASCVRGFAEVIALEHPALWGGMLDVASGFDEDDVAAVAAVVAAAGVEDHIAIRGGRRFVARIEPLAGPCPPPVPLRADATYLITGGAGALGLRVAGWMVERGARHLVLAGRNPPSPQARATIEALRQRGAMVVTAAADVAEAGDVRRMLDDIAARLPPLRGIVHAAGVYGHVALTGLDSGALSALFRPKVGGAWLLHQMTLHLDLDLFVLFSSVSALWGSKGQAHYAAANAFLDALAGYRRRQGLPALSIAWGPWAEGGMATAEARRWLARVGVRAMAPGDALAAMERYLGAAEPHIALADVDWACFREIYASGRARPLIEELGPAAHADDVAPPPITARLESEFALLTAMERHDWLVAYLQRQLVSVLHLGDAERPDPRKGFFRLGMDSLMAVELKNRLARDLGVKLSSTIAFDYPNISELAGYLATKVLGWELPAPRAEVAAMAATRDPPPEPLAEPIAAKLARLESLIREA